MEGPLAAGKRQGNRFSPGASGASVLLLMSLQGCGWGLMKWALGALARVTFPPFPPHRRRAQLVVLRTCRGTDRGCCGAVPLPSAFGCPATKRRGFRESRRTIMP